jgi:carbon monoxide dehydrogenase subunit G
MRVTGTYRYEAAPEQVYQLLLDPTALEGCIPGCQRLEATGPEQYRATLKVGIAAIRGTFEGDVTITDREPGRGYRMSVSARGGPGIVTGSATIRLTPDGDQTVVEVDGDAKIAGPRSPARRPGSPSGCSAASRAA